jgi:hypothetical protein
MSMSGCPHHEQIRLGDVGPMTIWGICMTA